MNHYQKQRDSAINAVVTVGDDFPYEVHAGGAAEVTDLQLENVTDSVIELWVYDSIDTPGSNGLNPQLRLRADPQSVTRVAVGGKLFNNGIWINYVAGDNNAGNLKPATTLPEGTIVSSVGFRDRGRIVVSD